MIRREIAMATYYVTCHSPDNYDLDRRLQGLGGHRNGLSWWHSIDVIVHMIDNQGETFFTDPVYGDGDLVVTRVHPVSGRKYLKTLGDGQTPNNLLSLPICPQ